MKHKPIKQSRIGFIGLGVMGYPMARHLATAGYRLTIHNRSPAKSARWMSAYETGEENKHHLASTPGEAAHNADWVIACVGNDHDLWTAIKGADGVVSTLSPGSCLINHGTSSVQISEELASACAVVGADFLDAPVSGGQVGAEQAHLSIFVGGNPAMIATAHPLFSCYAHKITPMGEVGSGQRTKMVNQICVAGLLQGLSEGLAFGKKAGLDGNQLLQAMTQGAAQSWQMENRAPTMLDNRFDFGFAVEWMHKDLGLCLEEAQRLGALTPITAIIREYYAQLMAQGDGRLDSSALIKRLP